MKLAEQFKKFTIREKFLVIASLPIAFMACILAVMGFFYEGLEPIMFAFLALTMLMQGLRFLLVKKQKNFVIAVFSFATSVFIAFVILLKLFRK